MKKIYFIDLERFGSRYGFRACVRSIDLETGNVTVTGFSNQKDTMHDLTIQILIMAMDEQPDKIFFDKTTFGGVLYDTFLKELDGRSFVSYQEDGTMTYKA